MKAKLIEKNRYYATYYPNNNHVQLSFIVWAEVIGVEIFNSKIRLKTKYIYYSKDNENKQSGVITRK
jgi:hypothetical protein